MRGRGTFQAIEKYPKDRRRQRRKHSRVFNGVFPGPLKTGVVGGGWGFRWAAKSAKSTATLLLGQKSRAFYGGYMIRPPGSCKDYTGSVLRWVARRHRPVCQPFNERFALEESLCPPSRRAVSIAPLAHRFSSLFSGRPRRLLFAYFVTSSRKIYGNRQNKSLINKL